MELTDRVKFALSDRSKNGLLRLLRTPDPTAYDFCSNDYLGLARSSEYQAFVRKHLSENKINTSGSTGSRLLSGHSQQTSSVESTAANFHQMPNALLFNSGYDANISVLSCVPGPEDVIVYDELVHASVHDGMRMSRAKHRTHPFLHNDVQSLYRVIRDVADSNCASIIVCIETIYSMDGDRAPVRDILNVCASLQKEFGKEIHVIADEAHAGGIFGRNGEGVILEENANVHPNLLAVIVTYGKAFAAHGAAVLSSDGLKEYLINYARPLIYSTALPPHSVAVIQAAYSFMKSHAASKARRCLYDIIAYFRKVSRANLPSEALLRNAKNSPIQGIHVPGNRECVFVANYLREHCFEVYPIRSPTVSRGSERIRIVLHSHNSHDDIDRLIKVIAYYFTHLKFRASL